MNLPTAPSADSRTLERARRLFASAGSDLSAQAAPAGASVRTHRFNQTLAPGQAVNVFKTDGPGRVVGLRLGPARAFAGKARDLLIKFYWDGESRPAISCPVGEFFGYSGDSPR